VNPPRSDRATAIPDVSVRIQAGKRLTRFLVRSYE
jgi:hypothetical protein